MGRQTCKRKYALVSIFLIPERAPCQAVWSTFFILDGLWRGRRRERPGGRLAPGRQATGHFFDPIHLFFDSWRLRRELFFGFQANLGYLGRNIVLRYFFLLAGKIMFLLHAWEGEVSSKP